MVTGFLAVALGVTALVAIQSIAESSERQVAGQMEQLGANLLVLPSSTGLQDYYAADMHGETLPEEYVTRVALARLVGVERLAPKLCVRTEFKQQPLVLTGILPQSEFQKKAAWQSVGMLTAGLDVNPVGTKHQGCKGHSHFTAADETDLSSYAKTRTVHELPPGAALLGADVADRHGLSTGSAIELMGETFRVAAVLPSTGTVDDGRVFAHLHSVQRIAETGPVVNVIEIMGCCEDAAGSLVSDLADVLPNARVVTISQIVQTQVAVNRLMHRLSYVLFAILILVAGVSVASVMYSNVAERRRELGTLMALGATPRLIARLILTKASVLGLAGGAGGLLLGCGLAAVLGPVLLDVPVTPSLSSALPGIATAVIVALGASYLPARRAATLDPCACFQEA